MTTGQKRWIMCLDRPLLGIGIEADHDSIDNHIDLRPTSRRVFVVLAGKSTRLGMECCADGLVGEARVPNRRVPADVQPREMRRDRLGLSPWAGVTGSCRDVDIYAGGGHAERIIHLITKDENGGAKLVHVSGGMVLLRAA